MSIAFNQLDQANDKDLLLVDATNLAFRWKHSGAKQFAESYQQTVASLARSYKCGKIILAADWGSSAYRKAISPSYKGNREELRAKQTEKEAEDFKEFFQEFENALFQVPWPVLKYKGVEADDIIAYICKYKTDLNINNIWIISSDKDLDLLISEGVNRFSYVTRKECTIDNWPYDFEIDKYATYKSLVGDTGDNVAGVPGIGPKRATSLIEQYGDVFDIIDQIPLSGNSKFIQNLNSSEETLYTNMQLMDLLSYCEDAIGVENCSEIFDKTKEYINE